MSPGSELDEMRKALLLRRACVAAEIGAYPTPISRCDAQFNHLLEERARLSLWLRRLDAVAAEVSAAGDGRAPARLTMNRRDFETLYEYNRWANARVLKAVSSLTAEQLGRDPSGGDRSLLHTLAHIAAAEWVWLRRWQGESPRSLPGREDFRSLGHLEAWWSEVERECAEFVCCLTDERLPEVVAYVNTAGETWRYTLSQMMQHLVNHSSYHRGQVSLMLRQLGAEPAPTDLLVFLDETGRAD
jgi:uncharacterized damage-inducible protein DinB